ncbi:hypothetical protein JRO89_XS02G0018500 [Xanthoceras sorbifolium]|uniref:Uncharacterized protein n=1 Tax=Xanthoceras sorbifolium TaxID=99658 RepID=A0ABQ8IDY8_9ROSI|nr:hypothetical protein JRO89_XS02G0018500 [Xanthoceras sorbifolium]
MSTHQEDLDLLLSLQEDRVLETPPGSPRQGYLSDDGSPRTRGQADMSAFRNVVQDCLDYDPEPVDKSGKLDRSKKLNDPQVEKFSGLRIRNQVLSPAEYSERFSDIRFVRLSAIKYDALYMFICYGIVEHLGFGSFSLVLSNQICFGFCRNLLAGDTISGCWATVGVLTEKGYPKTSSIGTWKFGCLDENTVSVFLFGDAYEQNCKEEAGTVFALFNCAVRKAVKGSDFSLSVSYASRILKLGTSVDYGVCKGKRNDGVPCTAVINKYVVGTHYITLFYRIYVIAIALTYCFDVKGYIAVFINRNLKTAFRYPFKSEGIYMVDPLADRPNFKKPKQPLKVLSVEGLRKALSNADKVTTNTHSQGIRFLNEITAKLGSKTANKEALVPGRHNASLEKRKLSTVKLDSSTKQQPDTKRQKPEHGQPLAEADKSKLGTGKMIELDLVSSDEEI